MKKLTKYSLIASIPIISICVPTVVHSRSEGSVVRIGEYKEMSKEVVLWLIDKLYEEIG